MARTRTVRVLAAAAALPLAAVMFGGVAHADNGGFASDGSNASVVSSVGSGVVGDNDGNSTTNQQAATGAGAGNQANNASVNGSGFTSIDQVNAAVSFGNMW